MAEDEDCKRTDCQQYSICIADCPYRVILQALKKFLKEHIRAKEKLGMKDGHWMNSIEILRKMEELEEQK